MNYTREYAILFSPTTKKWALIFKDEFETTWYVLHDNLSEDAAKLMLKGAQSE